MNGNPGLSGFRYVRPREIQGLCALCKQPRMRGELRYSHATRRSWYKTYFQRVTRWKVANDMILVPRAVAFDFTTQEQGTTESYLSKSLVRSHPVLSELGGGSLLL